uniref:Phosphatidylserine synthase n=1 Tax=Mucochytrium quahogii TaxID=96639 RepID=A0A7S2RQ52_9STRA|mmetsp:Transcript_11191/g.20802  ORF Transcript_11191/g.20802 Transcript_11191/m.20802 type:complete len:536 (-) Transcript_11191:245-1852(-)
MSGGHENGVRRRPAKRTESPKKKSRSRSRNGASKGESSKGHGMNTKSTAAKLDKATPGNIQEEGFIDAFYQPRTVTGLSLLIVYVLTITILQEDTFLTPTNRVKVGLVVSASAFLLYCVLQLRDGHLIRPHPAVWRIAHGAGLLYFILLTFLLCQELEGIQTFLKLFDPNVGRNETEHSYGDDCRIYIHDDEENPYRNLFAQIFDRFTIAHFAGWAIKALILRDWSLMWVCSVLFEILEVTFQHMYPNFNECWWDHLILDVFGCNFAGMVVGMKLVEYLNAKEYSWTGMKGIPSNIGKMKRVALQFTPRSFHVYRWQIFESWKRFVIGSLIVFILLLGEMNAFLIKSTFGIPIDSDINLYRLTFWVFMTYMTVFEAHLYAEGRTRRIGVNAWLGSSLVALETMLVVKHAYQQKMFSHDEIYPAPYIIKGWQATGVLVLLTITVKSARKLLVWAGGAEERFDVPDTTMTPTHSLETLEATLPGISSYVQAAQYLDRLFQVLTFAIPAPLVMVFLMDCYRTFHMPYPPPKPGTSVGW